MASSKSQLDPYFGELTPEEIAAGIAAAQSNAKRLLDDAKLLMEAARFPSATALAILAMEERGKVIILKRFALFSDPAAIKGAWKEYRSHRAKNAGWIIPDLVSKGARTLGKFAAAVDADGEHAATLDALKQIAFYTDCLAKRHWSIPDKVIDEKLCRTIFAAAEMMWGDRPVTVREIELWRQLVGPHYSKPTMNAAILEYQAALIAEGLSDTPVERMKAFMEGQPVEVGKVPPEDIPPTA